jgi:putative DNA primase/helicase
MARRSEPPKSSKSPQSPGPPDEGDVAASFRLEGVSADLSGGAGEAGKSARIRVLPDPERDRICATLPQTDLGNAERFRARFDDVFRFCPDIGWMRWDGRRWALLTSEKDELPGEVMQAVFLTVRAIANEARFVAASGRRDQLAEGSDEWRMAMDFQVKPATASRSEILFSDTIADHAKGSESKSRLGAIPALVQAFDSVLVRADQLDRDRMAINVRNGTIRLVQDGPETGGALRVQLDPHDPADLITKVANVVFDPDATAPQYDEFLARVQPDAADRRFLHQWAGLSSTGDIDYHKMVFFWGKGRNGKSTWVEAIAALLGEYAQTIKFDTFLEQASKRKGGDATPDLARLPGIRFLRTSEPEKGAKLAEALIKEVTGGEPMSVRHLNKGFFDFLPSFKLTAQGNYRPKISGHDDGIWGRVQMVPWPVRIPDSEIDVRLPAKLNSEASGIFNRMLDGLLDLKRNGFVTSENVRAATSKYREQSDQLGRFLNDCTADRPGENVRSQPLFELFKAWVAATGGGEWQPQGFAKAMEDRGYERKTSNGVWWLDIAATATVHDIEAGAFGAGGATSAASLGGAGGAGDMPAAPRDDSGLDHWDQ